MNYQIPLKYSQNLVKDSYLIENLISLTDLSKNDLVLDIGAGKGIIAKELSKRVKTVVAIEKDEALYLKAKENLRLIDNVELKNNDILAYKLPQKEYKVFSNIPFSLTLEITKKLFEDNNRPKIAYLFMQKEAAEKFVGNPLFKESLSSILYKPLYATKIIYNFRPDDFDPVPSKDVCLVEFKLKTKSDIDSKNYPVYRDLVTYAFNRWKPNIKLALKGVFSNLQLKILATNLDFDLEAKPSEISYTTWVRLFYEFNKIVPRYKQKMILGSFAHMNVNQINMRKVNKNNLEKALKDREENPRPKKNAWRGKRW